ncbi:MAG: class I tRNA ligase family protein [Chloroflexi bacterium]|nr:class I tRNA ligase family protein [Chloroflexota bacterium]
MIHRAIKKVTLDVSGLKFNTAIAALMEFSNALQRRPELHATEVQTLLLLLAPFAPHVTEELWEQIGGQYSIHQQAWPAYDDDLAKLQEVEVAVQINGKTRDVISAPAGSDEGAVVELAKQSERVQRHLGERPVVKTIFVPDRLVNFVIKP